MKEIKSEVSKTGSWIGLVNKKGLLEAKEDPAIAFLDCHLRLVCLVDLGHLGVSLVMHVGADLVRMPDLAQSTIC